MATEAMVAAVVAEAVAVMAGAAVEVGLVDRRVLCARRLSLGAQSLCCRRIRRMGSSSKEEESCPPHCKGHQHKAPRLCALPGQDRRRSPALEALGMWEVVAEAMVSAGMEGQAGMVVEAMAEELEHSSSQTHSTGLMDTGAHGSLGSPSRTPRCYQSQ